MMWLDSARAQRYVVIAAGILLGLLLLAGLISSVIRDDDRPDSAPTATSSGAAAPTTTHDMRRDAIPQVDGIYRVSDGGLLSIGIMAGWIQSTPRPAVHPHCSWVRLSGPTMTIENTIDTDKVTEGVVTVHIESTDYAFASYGCEPWQRIG